MSDSITTDAAPEATQPETAPNLSIADIQNAIRVIDYAAEQGAFKGWNTIEQVLVVRNKLNDFLKVVAPVEAPVAEAVG
jgi:hypothetical protein